MRIASPAFREGEPIPARHTCNGEDLSPPLEWTYIPPQATTLALIADDPDAPAGTWVHWVLYSLPAGEPGLPAGIPPGG